MKLQTTLLASATLLAIGLAGCGNMDTNKLGDMVGGNLGHGIKALGHASNAANLSQRDEKALGESAGISLTNTFPLSKDEALTTYVNYVGLTVSMGSEDPNAKYVFGVLETDQVNAWSTPGGWVFITKGVLKNCQNEAELAGVLAHEIAHINHHDGLDEVKAAELKAAAVEGSQVDSRTAGFESVVDGGVDVMTKQAHSQPSELKADAAAVHYLSEAGYDPNCYLQLLQRLKQATAHGGGIMGTHPGIDKRIATVSAELAKVPQGGATLAPRYAANMSAGRP
jgi:beta-barrel assembly-enhancing protease